MRNYKNILKVGIIGVVAIVFLTSPKMMVFADENTEIIESEVNTENSENTEEVQKVFVDLSTEKIETNYITMNTFIDTLETKYNTLSKSEVEEFFTSMAEKSFTELTKMEFNHEEKVATIQFYVNEDDGNLEALISTEMYNFLKATKTFVEYTIKFEVSARYTDSNGRYMKKLISIYTYKPETLILITWNNQEPSKILKIADEVFDAESKESTVINKQKENANQLKVINLLKYYISEKLSN